MMDLNQQIEKIGLSNSNEIFELLKGLDVETINGNVGVLLNTLRDTDDIIIINGCSVALADATVQRDEIKAGLINKLKELGVSSNLGTLIYACSFFDCSSDLKLFINLMINGSDEMIEESKVVLRNMSSIDHSELLDAYYSLLKKKDTKLVQRPNVFNNIESFLREKINNQGHIDKIKDMLSS